MQLGPYHLPNVLFVAPMAGVTDRPFRKLCKRLGAGYAVSEMVTSRPDLQDSLKTSRRADHSGEPGPIAVQIAGTDVQMMADAARYNIDRGAQIIDINMGLSGQEGLQQVGRFGPDAGRGAGAADCRGGGGRGGAAWRASDPQDAHRLVCQRAQCDRRLPRRRNRRECRC